MRYTLNFREDQYEGLCQHLLGDGSVERAAYLICGVGMGGGETRLLVRDLLPVPDDDVLAASAVHMSIPSHSFMRALKTADRASQSFVFVHSHPIGVPRHSEQDDREEQKLFRTAHMRVGAERPHASVVVSPEAPLHGRVWLRDGSTLPLDRIRVVGNRFRFFLHDQCDLPDRQYYDRQIRAFGAGAQALLARLRVGVVGLGGTGSAVLEQLVRLGIGTVVAADGDTFDASNVSRVYGSSVHDEDRSKVAIAGDAVARIGLGTTFVPVDRPVTFASALREFVSCDVVFACTDDQWGRSLLGRLALQYYVPILDMGVKLAAEGHLLRSIDGRVTLLMPGATCLHCRGRVTTEAVTAEVTHALKPEEAEHLRAEGYLDGVDEPAPAVIPFTTAIAAAAVGEFLLRVTQTYPADRRTTEILHLVDRTRVRTNRREPVVGCPGSNEATWGGGDTVPFLGVTWRPE